MLSVTPHLSLFVSTCNFIFCGFQEIALLSQFEHENIVEYSGTDKLLCFFLFKSSMTLLFFRSL